MKLSFLTLICFITMSFSFSTNANRTDDIPIGVQLWSVKDQLSEDFTGTIKALAKMNFDAVELAGDFGEFKNDPKGLKAFLDSQNLSVSGAHVSFDDFTPENITNTFNFYRTIGAQYLVVPWDERAWHPTEVELLIADLNRLFPIVKKAGFEFGYHNHGQEFNSFKGQTYWDYIAQNTDKGMILQLDAGWVNYAQKSPIHFVKAYPQRTYVTHIKVRTQPNSNQSVILGQDGYDWPELVEVMKEHGGTQWLIVEQEEYPEGLSQLESVAQSKAGFDLLLNR